MRYIYEYISEVVHVRHAMYTICLITKCGVRTTMLLNTVITLDWGIRDGCPYFLKDYF